LDTHHGVRHPAECVRQVHGRCTGQVSRDSPLMAGNRT
jgi:hypothetical protein